MEVLFISGNEGAGKTPTTQNLMNTMHNLGYNAKHWTKSCKETDAMEAQFIKSYVNDEKRKLVIINSPSDDKNVIEIAGNFIKQQIRENDNKHKIFIVTAARNEGDLQRENLLKMLNETCGKINVTEIPLARINENAGHEVHDWYHRKVDEIVMHILRNKPFNLF